VSTNVTIAGNFDIEIRCVPKRVDQTVKKASDGGANETKEHWIYDVTIENKTLRSLAISTSGMSFSLPNSGWG
jgi:hypothetical protein